MRADRTEAVVVASPEAPKPNATEPPTEKSAELAYTPPIESSHGGYFDETSIST